MVAHLISPLVAAAFAVVYWVIGMYNVMYPDTQWAKNWRGSNGGLFCLFSTFQISIFSWNTLYLPFASLSCRALIVWNGEKVAFLDSHDYTAHRSWDPQQSRQKPAAKISIPIQKLFLWDELIQNRKSSPQKLGKVSKPRSLQNRNLTLYTWCLPLFSPAKISHS